METQVYARCGSNWMHSVNNTFSSEMRSGRAWNSFEYLRSGRAWNSFVHETVHHMISWAPCKCSLWFNLVSPNDSYSSPEISCSIVVCLSRHTKSIVLYIYSYNYQENCITISRTNKASLKASLLYGSKSIINIYMFVDILDRLTITYIQRLNNLNKGYCLKSILIP